MASIETLIEQIADPSLRANLAREVGQLKRRRPWGLVFERHLPESTRMLVAPIRMGAAVWERTSAHPRRFVVRAIEGDELVVAPEPTNSVAASDAPTERIARADVLVEHDLAQPIFPTLTPIGVVRNGAADRRSHAVIQGENYHALEALLVGFERQFDVIYLDPPYNTGNRDWAYNNDYIDPNDTYRPSKWLAFMERRLSLAKRLIKPDGVLVVTIDENEVHHLGMLLEQLYPEARIQMVSIVINPAGVDQDGFSRVEEQAFFVRFGQAGDPKAVDPMLGAENRKASSPWESMLRRGTASRRIDRPTMFYPVLIHPTEDRVVGFGPAMLDEDPIPGQIIDGYRVAWPIRTDGSWGRWKNGAEKAAHLLDLGYLRIGSFDPKRQTWAVWYISEKPRKQIADGHLIVTGRNAQGAVVITRSDETVRGPVKTVWQRARHNAAAHGTDLLTVLLGRRQVFTFPKSLYAVRDTLDVLVHDKPNALILDFFAGSGTTLHATMLLNAQDGGCRQCFLVTNNEVRAETASRLNRAGHFRGDPEFEAAGVFEAACRPRITAALTGVRPDGSPVEGEYLDGRAHADGFEEDVAFLRLDYLDPAEVEFGLRFRELHPLLWLWAGGVGEIEDIDPHQPLGLPADSPYAILFDPSGMPALLGHLSRRPSITHVFIVAESDEGFDQLAAELPASVKTICLYRDYLAPLRRAVR